jgi:hypothetical protein
MTRRNTNQEESIYGQTPSLSAKGMIYIDQEPTDRRVVENRKRETGSIRKPYTLHAAQIYVWVVCDVFKSPMHNFDGAPAALQTEHRTPRKPGSRRTMPVPQL